MNVPTTPTPELLRIVLVGFMGAGKSTVGALLAARLGWQFVDTDRVIEQRSACTVAELFRLHGESFFRELEQRTIHELAQEPQMVMSIGGGAIEHAGTRTLLQADPQSCIVYLDAPLPVLVERCRPAGASRPLLSEPAALQALHARRLPHYLAAHLTIDTAELSPAEVAGVIAERLQERIRKGQPA